MSDPARGSTELLSSLMAYLDDVDSSARSSIAHLPSAPSQAIAMGEPRSPAAEGEHSRSDLGSPSSRSTRASRPAFVWDDWEAKDGSDAEEKASLAESIADEPSLHSTSTLSPNVSVDGPPGADSGASSRSNGRAMKEYCSATANSQRVSAGSQMSSRIGERSSTGTASAFRDVQAKVIFATENAVIEIAATALLSLP